MSHKTHVVLGFLLYGLGLGTILLAQEKSVNPGINDSFKDPDLPKFLKTFEGESREIFTLRKEIVAACQLKPGMSIADVGAGTGLFTRLFAKEVGEKGKVIAVDISDKFLDHIRTTCKEEKIHNVELVRCSQTSTELPENSVDRVFICDTYHHFEFPERTMQSVHNALKKDGELILIDFIRIEGQTKEWTLKHVRAGQDVFEKEIEQTGFEKIRQEKIDLKENYCVRFRKKPMK